MSRNLLGGMEGQKRRKKREILVEEIKEVKFRSRSTFIDQREEFGL